MFTTEVIGERELKAAFETVEKGMLDLRQLGAWNAVQSKFYKVEKELFASEGGSGKSGRWQQLSSPYKEVKARRYGPMSILQATGQMYRSLTSTTGDSIVEKTAQTLALGTRLKYAGMHHRGGGRLPQRKPIDMTDAQEKRVLKPIGDKLKQLAANAKLRDIRGF